MFSPKSPWLLAAIGVATLACEPGGVGDPCVPEEEYKTDFVGFGLQASDVEMRSFQCDTRVCIINHFQGRVSCPYGQTGEDVAAGRLSCTVPGSTDDFITVPVDSQFADRRADSAVYCSCRCDGPDANARYCECPSGFTCTELIPDLRLGSGGQISGSYCIKDGTQFNPTNLPNTACRRDLNNCEEE